LLDQLKKIDPDINKALEQLLNGNSRELKDEEEECRIMEIADKTWEKFKSRVDARIDIAIADARRGA